METEPDLRVRRAVAGDVATLRELRIQALTDAPAAFGSTLERELGRTSAEWARWVSPSATFILEVDAIPRGVAAGVPDADDASLVHLMAMWLDPALRGSGAADRLVRAVLDWATSHGAVRIRLDVILGNEAAIRLYERHGFRPTGSTTTRARDSAIEVQMERVLRPSGSATP
ncbi:MAG TPA: GNAT family N-acetyltransferase [Gemmatimonadales bacterium]|nr:GNAT family N-acetyltransferase [Gemmatimonadales bacterium]